jgi:hypothetical protein
MLVWYLKILQGDLFPHPTWKDIRDYGKPKATNARNSLSTNVNILQTTTNTQTSYNSRQQRVYGPVYLPQNMELN